MKKITLLIILLNFLYNANSQGVPILTFTNVGITGLSSPVDIVNAGDGTNRIFIVQRGGTIRVYDANYNLLNNNFLTISTDFTTGGERGLLSLAFHPNFENNRYFFVYYTNAAGGVNIDRFQTSISNPNVADAATRTNLMTIPKPVVYSNHNGGKLNFGPDGHLYFGLGDSGSGGDPGNLSQNGNSLWGKMIRINVDNFTTPPYYTIPSDNPFVSNPAILDEIFNIGLRNPWRWSFDRLNGDMWIGDVGQNAREEINRVAAASSAGVNYGWRCYEGLLPYNTTGCLPQSSYMSPVFEYPRNNLTGGFSVTGGYVYRGSLYPLLIGYYICSDYVSGNAWLIRENTPGNFVSTIQNSTPTNVSSFGETENGELMAITLGGTVYTISALSTLPVRFIDFTVTQLNGYSNKIEFKTSNEDAIQQYEIESSNTGTLFKTIGIIRAQNRIFNQYSFTDHSIDQVKNYYRIKIIHQNGTIEYSSIVSIHNGKLNSIQLNVLSPNSISVVAQNRIKEIQLYNSSGKLIHSVINNSSNQVTISTLKLNKGVHFIKVFQQNNTRVIQYLH